jgi:membrane-associated phospholipid phosphatase
MNEVIVKLLADASVVPVVIIGAWALLMIPHREKYRAYSRILMAGLTAYLVAKLIGAVFQPEVLRPFEKLGVEAGASFLNNPGFPSDHVLFCTAITLAVWFETRRVKTTAVLIAFTVLVAIGRVLGLVHTPLDVVGGIAIACVGALWYLQADKGPVSKASKTKSRKSSKKRVK